MNPNVNRALIFQGGGSLGSYEAGAYKAINEDLSAYFRTEGRGNEPIFHIISGTSIGAINAALLVSYVKENGKGLVKGLLRFGITSLHNQLLKTYLILHIIGILGVG
jgi:predicted acylesterase/phospholipase RssA